MYLLDGKQLVAPVIGIFFLHFCQKPFVQFLPLHPAAIKPGSNGDLPHLKLFFIPEILKAGGGAIVNISSILGSVGYANFSAYVTSKHAVVGLTRTAALEFATAGVRINAIGPGFVYTHLLSKDAAVEENNPTYNFISVQHAVKRMGKPAEIANAVIWLCSEKASFVTGTYLLVDGGYTAQ